MKRTRFDQMFEFVTVALAAYLFVAIFLATL